MSERAKLSMNLKTSQRMAIFGRMRMADWLQMPEREFAGEIEKLEKDPLFQKLIFGMEGGPSVLLRQRWPRARFGGGMYELHDHVLAGGQRVPVEEILGEKAGLLAKIRAMGAEAFEKYFLYGEEGLPLAEIAKRTGMEVSDAKAVHDMLLEIGAQAEFAGPSRDPGLLRAYSCLARIQVRDGEAGFEFFSPHWARGLYRVRYDLLEDVKRSTLEPEERRRLPHLLKKIETVNLRQNTLFRILESLCALQIVYLSQHENERLRPVSLRQLARRLQLAPSTISRALSGRSVLMPWGKEAPLIELLPGRRRVLRDILGRWLEAGLRSTDAVLAERLKFEYGIRVSRRTVNAVRNEVGKRRQAA